MSEYRSEYSLLQRASSIFYRYNSCICGLLLINDFRLKLVQTKLSNRPSIDKSKSLSIYRPDGPTVRFGRY